MSLECEECRRTVMNWEIHTEDDRKKSKQFRDEINENIKASFEVSINMLMQKCGYNEI